MEPPIAYLFYEPVGLNPLDEEDFVEAMKNFPSRLRQSPAEIDIPVERLPSGFQYDVLEILDEAEPICVRNSDVLDYFVKRLGYCANLIVGCQDNHPIALALKKANPDAQWGAAFVDGNFRGPLAFAYCPGNRHLIWHESLHLLGANDCYCVPNHRGPTCEQPNCIMQFEPNAARVGSWPWLCKSNIDRIRVRVGEWRNARMETT